MPRCGTHTLNPSQKELVVKRLIILTIVLSLAAGQAFAAGGLRGGLTVNPDQVHVGAHIDMGPALPPLRLQPNIEIGFGDDLTVVSLNGDLIYDVPRSGFYVGGELGVNFVSWDAPSGVDSSDSDLGLSALGGVRKVLASGTAMFFEAKIGLVDSPDFKATVGFDIF